MKKYIIMLIALAMGLAACNQKATFKVSVNLKNGNDQVVYLNKFTDNGFVVMDSADIVDEKAEMTAPIGDVQDLYSLGIKGMRGQIPFFADNKDVSVVGDINNLVDVEIKGSETQDRYNDYNRQIIAFQNRYQELYPLMEKAYNENDSLLMDSINKIGDGIEEEQLDFRVRFIKENADSFIAHYILNELRQEYELAELKDMMADFSTTSVYLDDLNEYVAKQERLDIGQPIIDFTIATNTGDSVTLSEVVKANKVTMVDFWASWCGPCRQENPIVKAAYEKYHARGFEIIAVSVDRKEADWLKAIEQDQLPYIHGMDAGSIAESYLVYYIPTNFLFDSNGNIIAKGLRGEDLEKKLAELLP